MALALWLAAPAVRAETCTTQSQMAAADRDALAATGRSFAQLVQANNAAGLQGQTIPQYAQNFQGIASAISATAPKLAGASFIVESVYLLDASNLKVNSDGSMPTAQFFCALNNSPSDTSFTIPNLPPGKYGLAMVHATGVAAPWQMTFVLQQLDGQWKLAGFLPKPLTSAGHDGIWYWAQARDYAKKGKRWNAWFYYQTARALLVPVDFLTSTNLEKLNSEARAVLPPELQNGISKDHPLLLKGKDETYSVTQIGTDDALGGLDLVIHVTAADVSNPVTARERNVKVMQAMLANYRELKQAFHGLWVFAAAPSGNPFGIELPMAQIQ
ncbi:MAG: hypothetical protein ACYC46_06710 [Acidobacteriaceae bacterium]